MYPTEGNPSWLQQTPRSNTSRDTAPLYAPPSEPIRTTGSHAGAYNNESYTDSAKFAYYSPRSGNTSGKEKTGTGLETRPKPVGGIEGARISDAYGLEQRNWYTGLCNCCAHPGCMSCYYTIFMLRNYPNI